MFVCVTEAALMFLSAAAKVNMLLHNGSRRSFSSLSHSFLSSPRQPLVFIAALRSFVLVSLPLCLFFSFLFHLHLGEVNLQGFLPGTLL